jgi:hypothetical protein
MKMHGDSNIKFVLASSDVSSELRHWVIASVILDVSTNENEDSTFRKAWNPFTQ